MDLVSYNYLFIFVRKLYLPSDICFCTMVKLLSQDKKEAKEGTSMQRVKVTRSAILHVLPFINKSTICICKSVLVNEVSLFQG